MNVFAVFLLALYSLSWGFNISIFCNCVLSSYYLKMRFAKAL